MSIKVLGRPKEPRRAEGNSSLWTDPDESLAPNPTPHSGFSACLWFPGSLTPALQPKPQLPSSCPLLHSSISAQESPKDMWKVIIHMWGQFSLWFFFLQTLSLKSSCLCTPEIGLLCPLLHAQTLCPGHRGESWGSQRPHLRVSWSCTGCYLMP